MMWHEAVADRFASGAEMVVVFPVPDAPGDLMARGIILNGLRKSTGERDLERAAAAYGDANLNLFLAMSAIDGIQDGPTERAGL
jgi:hypothetical protein